MITPTLFDIEEPRLAAVPICDLCGASGPRVEDTPETGGFNGAVLFALVELAKHKKEMHSMSTGVPA